MFYIIIVIFCRIVVEVIIVLLDVVVYGFVVDLYGLKVRIVYSMVVFCFRLGEDSVYLEYR